MGLGTIVASLLSIVLAVGVVAALAFGFIYLLRMWQDRSIGAAEPRGSGLGMSFLRTLPLGQSERLVLVEVGEEVLLIGVASHNVSLIRSWRRDELPESIAANPDLHGPRDLGPAAQLAARFRAVPGLGGQRRATPGTKR